MKSPFSPERLKVIVAVTLVLMMSVGVLYGAIVGTVLYNNNVINTTPQSDEVFVEEPEKLPWQSGGESESSDSATTVATEATMELSEMSGQEIYTMLCALCHGPEGNSTPNPATRVPTLNHPDVLAVSSDEFLSHIIRHGRSGTGMAPMGELLKDKGVASVVAHIRSWEAKGADPTAILSEYGKVLAGRAHFRNLCAGCHGMNGEGGVGVALNSPAVLGQVTDHYLANTIINGRSGTAMASWRHLETQTLNDLLAYLRSWQGDVPVPAQDVANRVVDARFTAKDDKGNAIYTEQTDRALHVGKLQYERYCMECHGVEGKMAPDDINRFAPTLNNKEFLEAASDGFILATIARGRSHTPMRAFGIDTPGSKALGAQSMRDIVSYMRSWKPPVDEEQ